MATQKPAEQNAQAAQGNPLEQAIALLTADHDDVKNLFREYKRLMDIEAPDAQREAVAAHICNALTLHALIEEEIFYPAAREALPEDKEELLDHADIEHGSLKALIAAIESSSADDAHFDARVHVLAEYVEHHVKDEEEDMFSELRQSDHDFADVHQAMLARKQALQAQVGKVQAGQKPAVRATSLTGEKPATKRTRVSPASARKQVKTSGSAKQKKKS